MKLVQGVAFVLTHKDGTRELHVFTENGTLRLPDTVVSLYQVGEPPRISGGTGTPGAVDPWLQTR